MSVVSTFMKVFIDVLLDLQKVFLQSQVSKYIFETFLGYRKNFVFAFFFTTHTGISQCDSIYTFYVRRKGK